LRFEAQAVFVRLRGDFFGFLFAVLLLLAGIVTSLKTRDAKPAYCAAWNCAR
jgi:hypothetical protein